MWIICSFSIVLLSNNLVAQITIQDVIYLKNGSYIRGSIVNSGSDTSVNIKLETGTVLSVSNAEIKEIKQETRPHDPKSNWDGRVKHSGFTTITELYIMFGSKHGADPAIDEPTKEFGYGLSVINGFTISPYIHLGAGIAFEKWSNLTFLPIFIDLRVNFMAQSVTPFFYTDVGYSPGWLRGYKGGSYGGVIGGLGLGAKFFLQRHMAFSVSIGYRFQQFKEKGVQDASFFAIRTGLVF